MLAGAEVVTEQRGIRGHHAHQRHALEVVPLGDHLRADQDVDGPLMHGVEQRFGAALAAGGVRIDARHACLREQRAEGLLDALRAAPQRRDIDIAAVRAMVRDARFVAAMVAAQPVLRLVEHQVRRAARTARQPAARIARQHRRVAAAVEEQQALLAAREAVGNGIEQRLGQPVADLPARAALQGQVDQRDARQHRVGLRTLRQHQARGGALLGAPPGLQRRRGRPEHNRDAALLGPPQCQVARGIAQALLLLVGGVVLLVDEDQREVRQRGQHRQPRAEHDARFAAVRRQPVQRARLLGQTAVQRSQRHPGKTRGNARLQLRRQVDLGHQHQHLRGRVAREGIGDGVQVDLGLAAAGDPVQQERRKAATRPGLRNAGDGSGLLGIERRSDGRRRRLVRRRQQRLGTQFRPDPTEGGPIAQLGYRLPVQCNGGGGGKLAVARQRFGQAHRAGRAPGDAVEQRGVRRLMHQVDGLGGLSGQVVPAAGRAPQRRQCRQRHFAQRPVVITGGKFGQCTPLGIQRRHPVEHALDIPQAIGRHLGGVGRRHHQRHHAPVTERHHHQLTRHDRLRTAVVENGIQRRIDHHPRNGSRTRCLGSGGRIGNGTGGGHAWDANVDKANFVAEQRRPAHTEKRFGSRTINVTPAPRPAETSGIT